LKTRYNWRHGIGVVMCIAGLVILVYSDLKDNSSEAKNAILGDIINCQNQNCPNQCSGHGACNTTTGQCKCSFGYFGVDCSSIQPLFQQCVRVDQISSDVCVKLEYSECYVTFSVSAGIIPLYSKQYSVGELKTVFNTDLCFDGLGCRLCFKWKNLVLNDKMASGCIQGTFTCAGIPFGNREFGCFQDTDVIPQCFGTCPKNCSGNGNCQNAFCKCNDGFQGDDCSVEKSCISNCGGHGVCSKGNCFCSANWNGTDCTIFTGPKTTPKDPGSTGIIILGSFIIAFIVIGVGISIGAAVYCVRKRRRNQPKFNQLDLLVENDQFNVADKD